MKENGDVWKELLSQKAEVLRGIAGPSDNAKLRIWTEWLSRELDLEAKHKGLLLEAERLIAERQQPVVEIPGSGAQLQLTEGKTKNEWTLADLPKRERARLARDVYFARQKEKGKNYRKVRRIYYRSDEGIVA